MGTYWGTSNPMGGGAGASQAVQVSYDDATSGLGANVQAALDALEPKVDGAPNGFPDRSEVTLSWDNPTRTLTISPTGEGFSFYSDGNANAVRSKVVTTDTGENYIDWLERLTPRAPL